MNSNQRGLSLRTCESRIAIAITLIAVAAIATATVQAQTLTVLHSFTGGRDGANPMAGLTADARGNLYGTAAKGAAGYGTVFKLGHTGSNWIFTSLYTFGNGPDGAYPMARVVFGPNQTLYGTTYNGGLSDDCTGGCGTVFNLQPQPTACVTALCPWIETILLRFSGNGGAFPESEVTFDNSGDIFGTASAGGPTLTGGGSGCYPYCGIVYELTHSNGGWTESTPYAFTGYQLGDDGAFPAGGVTFDNSGNLFGTTAGYGNCGFGIVFKLVPGGGSRWNEQRLQDFCEGGASPAANMILAPSGTFYGDTVGEYPGYGTQPGSVFSLAPNGAGWTFTTLYTFTTLGGGPAGQLLLDSSGNLYGTTVTGGSNPHGTCPTAGCGTIFKLTPSGGSWIYTDLYDFTGGTDGAAPYSNLVMDASGNLYGTASAGGNSSCAGGCGVIFKFTP
jgi:uncharacterized repeat protein (TIGR03803 family)